MNGSFGMKSLEYKQTDYKNACVRSSKCSRKINTRRYKLF